MSLLYKQNMLLLVHKLINARKTCPDIYYLALARG